LKLFECIISQVTTHSNNFKIISSFISHVTMSETEIELFQPLKEF